jgi:hypothetical protein
VVVVSKYAVYLDDSGHPADQPCVIAAGFLSSEQGWLAFEAEWKAALKKHKIGDVFHMADFHGKWTKREEGQVLQDLTEIITKHVQAAFSVIVDMKAYRWVNELYPLEECIGTPYAIAARTVAKGINEWKAKFYKQEDSLQVLVEAGTKHMGDMEEAFRRDHLPVPQKVPKAHTQAQPCDLFAWEVFHSTKYNDRRRSLFNLISKVPFLFEGIMRERNLMHIIREVKIPLRTAMPDNVQVVFGTAPKRPRRRTIE